MNYILAGRTNEERHADMVHRLYKPGSHILRDMSPDQAHLLHMAIGISGEAGEILDAIKKIAIYGKDVELVFENLLEELGDLEFYMEGLRQGLKIDRELTLVNNIKKLGRRYPRYEYTDKGALDRADKNGE
jgi:NTP pyrophosphatase (non-canonical NTP hydrolase)